MAEPFIGNEGEFGKEGGKMTIGDSVVFRTQRRTIGIRTKERVGQPAAKKTVDRNFGYGG